MIPEREKYKHGREALDREKEQLFQVFEAYGADYLEVLAGIMMDQIQPGSLNDYLKSHPVQSLPNDTHNILVDQLKQIQENGGDKYDEEIYLYKVAQNVGRVLGARPGVLWFEGWGAIDNFYPRLDEDNIAGDSLGYLALRFGLRNPHGEILDAHHEGNPRRQ